LNLSTTLNLKAFRTTHEIKAYYGRQRWHEGIIEIYSSGDEREHG
jgi:hypothetical protein